MPILKSLALIQAVAKATDATLDVLRDLAVQFRALYLIGHDAHHETEGPTFYQDHAEFGALYPIYEGIYDGLVERVKGLGGRIDLMQTKQQAVNVANTHETEGMTAEDYFSLLLFLEKRVCGEIDVAVKEPTMDEGVRNLLCGIVDDSQKDRQYKIQQRLGGAVVKAKDALGHGSNPRNAANSAHPKAQEGIQTGMIDKKPAWHFEDATGTKRIGTYDGSHDFGGTDITYRFREAGTNELHLASGSHLKNSERLWGEGVGKSMATFSDKFNTLGSFQANIGKAGKGWYHGNQIDPGSTSVRADKYAAKMKEAREQAKAGSALNAKAAEMEAMEHWKKMAPGERGHAMQMLNDSAADDIGKSRDRGFEFGHGRTSRKG